MLIPTTASSPLLSAGFPAIGLGQDGSGEWKITNTGTEYEDCSNSGTLSLKKSPFGRRRRRGDRSPAGRRLQKGVIFDLVALEGFESAPKGDNVLPCDPSEWWQQTIEGFIGAGSKHAGAGLPDVRPLTAKIQLEPSDPEARERHQERLDRARGGGLRRLRQWQRQRLHRLLYVVGHRQIHQAQVQKLSRRREAEPRPDATADIGAPAWPRGQ